MDRSTFFRRSQLALKHIDDALGELEHEDLDCELAGDVLTLSFRDGGKFIINAHSAALQIWMAAGSHAWHFDYVPEREAWVASKNGDELMQTVAQVVGEKLGQAIKL